MTKIILKILHFITNYLNKLINHLNKQEKPLTKIISTQYDKLGNYFVFIIKNEHLLGNFEVLPHIFNILKNNESFINFGQYKVIIISAIINGQETSFHHNILINNNTTYQEYFNKVKDYINEIYGEYGYNIDVIPLFKVTVFNMDKIRNQNIKITKSTVKKTFGNFGKQIRSYSTNTNLGNGNYRNIIKPISKSNLNPIQNDFITIDIETVKNMEGNQIPICITTSNNNDNRIFINHLDKDVLWNDFFTYLINNNNLTINYIFVHNLGSFDGYFIYKALSIKYKPEQVNTIIDHHNKFISITLKLEDRKFIWLDSYRIFPISLNQLCQVFEVPGKISEYNNKFNDINLFNDKEMLQQFKDYALQDSISLYQALIKAQDYYLSNYLVDITTIVSTSSLSLKIFRSNFLKVNIPILKGMQDSFIRKSYYGGHTDIYEAYLKNGYYYDINSLYPFAMLKDIPF